MQGKVAIVTGAARGQGRSHSVRLAQEGADIIAVDICAPVDSAPYALASADDLAETAALVEELDRRVVVVQADVRDHAAMARAVDQGVAELGRLDVVVANAGITSFASAADLTPHMWQEMIDINLTGVWNTCQVSLPHLRRTGEGGSIVITSSTAGLRGAPNIAHYAAAKHGVVGIMRSLARELAAERIRVNTVHPTTVDTDMLFNDAMYKLFRPDLDAPTRKDAAPAFQTLNPIPVPWVEMSDISNAVLFLASEESRYITSVALPVDAGATQI